VYNLLGYYRAAFVVALCVAITSGILNVFLFRLKFVFIKHWFCQSAIGPMHPKHKPRLPVTWKPSNPFTWTVSEGSLEAGGMILSVTLRSLYALVSHLCLTGLPEVAYSDLWQDCQITFPHTRPTTRRAIGRSTPRPYMETSTRSTTYQMDRPTPPR